MSASNDLADPSYRRFESCRLLIMEKRVRKKHPWIYWTPRVLTIIFILFLALFSSDVFSPGLSFWQILGGLFMHNIPSFILIIVLIIAWKHEIVGGIAFVLAGILYIASLLMNPQLEWYMLSWSLTISGPAFLIGVLFFVNWRLKKKQKLKK